MPLEGKRDWQCLFSFLFSLMVLVKKHENISLNDCELWRGENKRLAAIFYWFLAWKRFPNCGLNNECQFLNNKFSLAFHNRICCVLLIFKEFSDEMINCGSTRDSKNLWRENSEENLKHYFERSVFF